jgi:hypothetical protein
MRFRLITTCCLWAAAAGIGQLNAQVDQTVKVDVKEVKTQEQKTPQIPAVGVKEHAWRPKSWLEIDVALTAKKAKTPGDNTTMVDALDMKFFIGLNVSDANKKPYLLTGTLSLQNVPTKVGEQAHVLAYVSPNTMRRLFGDAKTFNPNADIKAIALEISYGGQVIGGYPIGQGKWWDDLSKFAVVDGEILPKLKSPFAPLWGDYDVDVKEK